MLNPVDLFIKQLISVPNPPFASLKVKQYAGITFLYVHQMENRPAFEQLLHEHAQDFVKGTVWQIKFKYIRQSHDISIYQLHLRVPDEKSFCCGNGCPRCILYQ